LALGTISYFQDLADKFISEFIASRKDRRTSIDLLKIKQGQQESLAEFVRCLHQEAVLILGLEHGVTYTSFLNGLKSGHFKFSLAEQKEATLAKVLGKAADFIRAMEICADNSDAPKKARTPVDRNPGHSDRNHGPREKRPQLEVVDRRFTTDLRSIFMEVRGRPMLRRPPPMIIPSKPHNARKYCEFHEQNGHTTAKCREMKRALHELADKVRLTNS